MRGIVLAGGFGKRLAPFTNVSNKHLAPIYDETNNLATPMIYYPLNTLKSGGVTDIMIITSQEHCGDIVRVLGDGNDMELSLTYRIQNMNRPTTGIAQALALSKDFAGNENIAVILGDNYYEDNFYEEFMKFENKTSKLKNLNVPEKEKTKAKVFLKEVHDPERFGVADFVEINEEVKVNSIEEKPENPKTNWAVTGLYLYTPEVFYIIPQMKPSKRKELEITDVNNWFVDNENMSAVKLKGFWHDAGTPNGVREIEKFLAKESI
jgi:glucose-1-phosphate thymidylyltransferase